LDTNIDKQLCEIDSSFSKFESACCMYYAIAFRNISDLFIAINLVLNCVFIFRCLFGDILVFSNGTLY